MKKLLLSAFAASLSFLPTELWSQGKDIDDFLGLESEIAPELKGSQKFTLPTLHQTESWNVKAKDVEIDLPRPVKGQKYSLISWQDQDPIDFLDIEKWMRDRDFKDKNENWKIRLRDQKHAELAGKVLQCRGECLIYRGTNPSHAEYLSQVTEGDELKTGKNSVAWVFLMDGTLTRIGPESSVTYLEFNLGQSEVFIHLRLNHGHLFSHPRTTELLESDFFAETDAVSIPLLVREANEQHFERESFQAKNDSGHLQEIGEFSDPAIIKQFARINSLKEKNNPSLTLKTRLMVVAPNATLVSQQASFDLVYLPGYPSYFSSRQTGETKKLDLYLRGYNVSPPFSVPANTSYRVDHVGRNYFQEKGPNQFRILQLLTKRIKTLELAREIWVDQFTVPVFKAMSNQQELALEHGYKLWGPEFNQRIDFLTEYTRRIETTNLRAISNLMAKLKKNGESVETTVSDIYYKHALNYYLRSLKNRYTDKRLQVRAMSDLQYYAWILRNGKI